MYSLNLNTKYNNSNIMGFVYLPYVTDEFQTFTDNPFITYNLIALRSDVRIWH